MKKLDRERRLIGKLTTQEQIIYNFIVLEGLSQKQIADHLEVHVKTVKSHLNVIYRKKQVTGMWKLIVKHYKGLHLDEHQRSENQEHGPARLIQGPRNPSL